MRISVSLGGSSLVPWSYVGVLQRTSFSTDPGLPPYITALGGHLGLTASNEGQVFIVPGFATVAS